MTGTRVKRDRTGTVRMWLAPAVRNVARQIVNGSEECLSCPAKA